MTDPHIFEARHIEVWPILPLGGQFKSEHSDEEVLMVQSDRTASCEGELNEKVTDCEHT